MVLVEDSRQLDDVTQLVVDWQDDRWVRHLMQGLFGTDLLLMILQKEHLMIAVVQLLLILDLSVTMLLLFHLMN